MKILREIGNIIMIISIILILALLFLGIEFIVSYTIIHGIDAVLLLIRG